MIGFVSGAGVGVAFSAGNRGRDAVPPSGSSFQPELHFTSEPLIARGGSMRKLLGALTLAAFLCVSGATYAQDTEKKDDAKQETTKKKETKKKSSKKKTEKKEEKKDENKPS
jgi:mannitol-specific phosphotransferase system IIBC component